LGGALLEQPTAETLAAPLMRALDRSGRQSEAIDVYGRTRQRVRDELGTEPGSQLQSLYLELLRRRPLFDVDAPGGPSAPPGQPPIRHLPTRVADFTGRSAERRWLDDLVTADGRTGAINGMAGVGKTALAIDAAYRFADRYPDAQLWLDLHGHTPGQVPLDPAAALDTLLRRLGVPAERIPADPDERAALWRAELAGRRCVVVLDNAASAAQVRPLLADAPGTLVLVTSRCRLVALEGARSLSLEVLRPAEAADLLVQVAGGHRVAGDRAALAEAVRLCGYLPLAIRVAGARLQHRPTWLVTHLVTRLNDERRRLAELTAEDLSVATSFALSYQQISDDQRRAFRLLGLFPGADLDAHAAAALIGVELPAAERVLEGLVDTHLLEQPEPGRYRFHDLLRHHARHTAQDEEPESARHDATGRLLDFYLAVADIAAARLSPRRRLDMVRLAAPPASVPSLGNRERAMAWLDAERSNLVAVVGLAAREGWWEHAWQLPARLWHFFYLRGHLADWLETHRLALTAALDLADPAAEALTRTYLGIGSRWAGRFPEALDHLERALTLHREAGDQVREASTLNGLGITYGMLGRYAQAMTAYRDSARIWAELGDALGEGDACNNLGELLTRLRRPAEAVAKLRLAQGLLRTAGYPHGEADVLRNLGEAYSLLGQPGEALACCQRALVLLRAAGGRRAEATMVNSLGVVHRRAGRLADAVAAHEQALELARRVGTDIDETEVLNDLGTSCRLAGRPERALSAHRDALTLARRIRDPYEEARALDGIGHALPADAAGTAAVYRQQAVALFAALDVPRAEHTEWKRTERTEHTKHTKRTVPTEPRTQP
jgi:tetratricopeptide (TPR) repeat protein